MILMYHKIAAETPSMWWVSADAFYRQMWELQSRKVVYLDEYDPADPSNVCITFDGVYENIHKFAVPILEHFNYPYELFVVGDNIGQTNDFDKVEPYARFADFEQLRDMIRRGGRLQWHTRSHLRLDDACNSADLRKELYISPQICEIDPAGFRWIAYPHGEFSARTIEEARKRFAGGVSCHQGNGVDLFELNRQTVVEDMRFQERRLGVVIPSYNYGRFLAEAAESVLRQTVLPDRILIIDDASDDDTPVIGAVLQQAHSDLITFHRNDTNMGIVPTFNKAVEMIDTDYVVFLGADNRFAANYVEGCAEQLDADPQVGVVYTDFALFGPRAPIVHGQFPASLQGNNVDDAFWWIHFPESPDEVRRVMAAGENVIHGSSMFRRQAWLQSGGYQHTGDLPEDFDLFRRMLDRGWEPRKAIRTHLEYRHHSQAQANAALQTNTSFRVLKEAVERLQATVQDLSQRDQATQKLVTDLRQRDQATQKMVVALKQRNEATQKTVTELRHRNEELVTRSRTQAAEVANLRGRLTQTNRQLHSKSISLAEHEGRVVELTKGLRRQLQATKKLSRLLDNVESATKSLSSSRRWKMANPIAALTAMLFPKRRLPSYGHLEKIVTAYSAWRTDHPPRTEIDDAIQALAPRATSSIATEAMAHSLEPRVPTKPIQFAVHNEVEISIVIPVFNQLHFTQACLAAIQEHQGTERFEVIVVDDGSTDATAEWIAQIPGLIYLRNETNAGFVASCNTGAAKARGSFLVFLNNDTEVTPGWLGTLRETFECEPRAGLVGAKLIFSDGRLQEAGGIIWRDGSGWNRGKFEDRQKPEYNFLCEVDYCSAACLMVPKTLFESVGGFDSKYAPAYYEDTDLAFKIRRLGHKVLYQPFSEIIHFEGATSGTDLSSGAKKYQEVNRATFAATWSDVLAEKPVNGDVAGNEALKPGQKRILVVDHHLPMPDRDSGSLRMFQILKILQKLGHRITFVPDNIANIRPYSDELQKRGIEVFYHPYIKTVRQYLEEHGHQFDVVILSRCDFAKKHIADVRLQAPQSRVIFDTVDLHFLRQDREAQVMQDTVIKSTARSKQQLEYELIDQADETWVVSAFEQELLRNERPEKSIQIVSNIVDVHGSATPFSLRHDFLFIGSFQHTPNIDAVIFFTEEIFPLVSQRLPEAKFYVIGDKAPPAVIALANENIIVTGLQRDVRPYFDSVKLSVAPLRFGAGVKGKVNQSMGFGVPVVATSVAVEGMALTDREDVLIGDTAADFARALIDLYQSEELWERVSTNGLEKTKALYSGEAAQKELSRLFSDDHFRSSEAASTRSATINDRVATSGVRNGAVA